MIDNHFLKLDKAFYNFILKNKHDSCSSVLKTHLGSVTSCETLLLGFLEYKYTDQLTEFWHLSSPNVQRTTQHIGH